MKKLLFSVLSVLVAMNMSAITYQDQVSITLDDGTYLPNLVVGESNDLPDRAIQNGYAAEVQDLNAMPLALYTVFNGVNYSSLAMKNMTNMPIVIKTTAVTSYTFYFDDVIGSKPITIYDAVEGVTIPVTEGGDYSFTIDASLCNSIISNRFILFRDVLSVVTNAYGFCTFAADVNVTLPAGLRAYKGAVNAEGDELALTQVADIPAAAGVVLYGAANTTYSLTEAVSASADMSGNNLVGCPARTAVSGDNIFVLSGNSFLQYTGAYIPAGKAYLLLPGAAPAPGRRLSIRFETPTAVENAAADAKAQKLVRDGQLLILRDGKTYNAQGQLVK